MKLVKDTGQLKKKKYEVSDQKAEEAIRTIIQWIGEDPEREGLLSTPKRVIKAFKEYFKGYSEDPNKYLSKTFTEVEGYDDMVIEKNISIQSHCEHHMAPIIGLAHVAYIPSDKVVGLSKLARTRALNNANCKNNYGSFEASRCCGNNRCSTSMHDQQRCEKRKYKNCNQLFSWSI